MKLSISSVAGMTMALYLMLLSLSSCSLLPTPHENFKSAMQSNIGKREDDPSSYLSRYSESVADRSVLPNGNTETEFRWRKQCPVFFEIDSSTHIIVGWRFEGSEHDCAIVP